MRLPLAPRTLTRPTLILLAIAGLFAAVTSDPNASLRDRTLWLGAAVIAQVALTAVYLAGARMGAGHIRLGVLGVVIAGAAARGLTLALIVNAAGVTDPLPLGQRILSSTVTFTAWGVLFGAVVQGWQDYQESLRALLLRVDRTLEEATSLSEEWRARLRSVGTSPAELSRTAKALHADIAERLRPLSHRLWFGITDGQSRRRFVTAFTTEPWPAGWIALAATAVYVWTTAYHFGLAYSLIGGLLTNSIVAAILVGSNRLSRHHPAYAPGWHIAALLLALTIPAGVGVIMSSIRDPLGLIAIIAGLGGIIVAVQVIAVSLRQRRSALSRLSLEVDALDNERDSIATHLHSAMQSQWTAAAMRLQAAAESGDIDSASLALAQARAVVEQSGSPARPIVDPADLIEAWRGIAAISMEIDPGVPEATSGTLSHLIEEAISNAVRHGRARNVSVLVTVTDSTVEVIIDDDGNGIDPLSRPGFGSRWLDQVAEWSISRDGAGTSLRASIPCGPG